MILGVWATHRNMSTRMIERLTVSGDDLPDRIRALMGIHGIRECFILSTCNRVEVYGVVDRVAEAPAVLAGVLDLLAGPADLSPDEVRDLSEFGTGDEVVRHLMAVTCGLDSMVVGEYQIVSQVRAALRVADSADAIGPVLGNLLRAALRTSKRARTATAIGGTGRSMVSVGLERAAACLGDLTLKSGLLIGAGRMGALAGPLLREAGVSTIVVTNRTEQHARQLAEKIWGVTVGLPGLVGAISAADVIVSSTGAPGYMVTAEQVAEAMRQRPEVPLFVLDLALPMDIDPLVRKIPNVTVVDIEDIGAFLREQRATTSPPRGPSWRSPLWSSSAGRTRARWLRSSARCGPSRASWSSPYVAAQPTAAAGPPLAAGDGRGAARRRQAAAHPHRAGQGTGHRTGWVAVRRGPHGAVRPGVRGDVMSGSGTGAGRRGAPAGAVVAERRALRLGTRRSRLALTQSGWVADQVASLSGRPVELVEIVTAGDVSTEPIASMGTTGVFVTALRESLLRGEVDFVVHSFKDLPAAPMAGLSLAAVPVRQDPRDALVARGRRRLRDLPPGSVIGTGSARRTVELRRLGLPVTVVPLRGNVDTRLRRIQTGDVDAVILAAAGLIRLGLRDVITELIDPELILPAPAQGALAVECRTDDTDLLAALAGLDDPAGRATAAAERAYLATLNAGCTAPVGAHARLVGPTTLALDVLSATADGAAVRMSGRAPVGEGVRLGHRLATAMLTDTTTRTATRTATDPTTGTGECG
jgi:hydroxymethylbilane synthase